MSDARETVDRTLALFGAVQKGLNQLETEHGVQTRSPYQQLIQTRDETITVAREHGVLGLDERNVWQNALRQFDVQAHITDKKTTLVDDADTQFDDGKICKLTFATHHAPHYVMQLENGFFIAMTAPVEDTAGGKHPFGIDEEKLHEHLTNDSVQVNWLDKDQSPFGRKTTE